MKFFGREETRDGMWAWTTLDIDEDIMHPVERLSRRLGEIAEAKGKFVAIWHALNRRLYPLPIRRGLFIDNERHYRESMKTL